MGLHLGPARVHLRVKRLGADPGRDHGLFLLRGSLPVEDGRITDAGLGRLVLRDELLQNPYLAHLRMRTFPHEIADERRPVLSVPIDPAVALLEPQKRTKAGRNGSVGGTGSAG